MNKIHANKKSLVIEIPLKTTCSNPYSESENETMDNIIGLIIHHEGYDECGFAYRIDMSYKGKDDQWTDFFYKEFGDCDEFKELCEKLKIAYIEEWEKDNI